MVGKQMLQKGWDNRDLFDFLFVFVIAIENEVYSLILLLSDSRRVLLSNAILDILRTRYSEEPLVCLL